MMLLSEAFRTQPMINIVVSGAPGPPGSVTPALLALVAEAETAADTATAKLADFNAQMVDGEALPGSANLFDYSKRTAEAIVDGNGGTTASTYFNLSPFVPVLPSTTYTTKDVNRVEYDAAKQIIAGSGYLQVTYGNVTFTTKPTAAFVRFNIEMDPGSPYAPANQVMFVQGSAYPSAFIAFSSGATAKRIPALRINADQITGPQPGGGSTTPSALPFAGKKLLVIGDSITEAASYGGTANAITNPYHKLLGARLGFTTVYSRGIGGSAIQKRGTVNNNNYDANYPPLCDANRIASLPSDPDVILIYMGVNDAGFPLGAGVGEQNEFTLSGGLNSAFSQLIAKYPTKPIVFASPLNYGGFSGTVPINTPGVAGNANTVQIADMIRAICRQWGIPYCALNEANLIRFYSPPYFALYLPDQIHPNNAGHALIAPVMEKTLLTLIPAAQI